MRYFNYHGPVNPQEHYFITRRELLAQLMVQSTCRTCDQSRYHFYPLKLTLRGRL
jgi:hypothetical protein